MHLQLTMLENEVPLIRDTAATGYSPWQGTDRPINGLLHGLFVFRVIDQWLEGFGTSHIQGDHRYPYVLKRRAQIAEETRAVKRLGESPSLTQFGRKLANWLLAPLH